MQKEKKRVPKLRFEGFEGEWEKKKFSKYIKLYRGSSPRPIHRYQTNDEDGVNWIKIGDTKDVQNYTLKTVSEKITKEGAAKSRAVKRGELILANSMSFGKTYLLDIEGCIYDGWFVLREYEEHFNRSFLLQLLNSEFLQQQYKRLSTGGVVQNISSNIVYSTILSKPELKEQQKIATFLTSIDTRIQLLEKKKTLLEQYKKGVMQRIFKQEIRFRKDDGKEFSEWEERKLGDVANITTGSSNRQDSSLTGAYTFFDRSMDIRTSSIYLFEGEAVIVAGEGSDFIPKYFVGKFDLHQRTYAIMDYKGANGRFLYYYIYYHRKYFLQQAVGSTVKSLRLPMFKKMPLLLPCLTEQTKIAHFLSALDRKIAVTNEQIEKTKEWKKGLLQRMFV